MDSVELNVTISYHICDTLAHNDGAGSFQNPNVGFYIQIAHVKVDIIKCVLTSLLQPVKIILNYDSNTQHTGHTS